MRLGIFGDVMGRSGRHALIEHLPRLRRRLALDFIVVNVENAAGGFGVTGRIADEIFDAGADVLTTGNHAFDQREELALFDDEARLLRPANFPQSNPGRGSGVFKAKSGQTVGVVHVQGQRGMAPIDDPCAAVDRELDGLSLGREADAIIVDFHAETTSEKYSMGHYLDGRVSAVVGTHTHVPTADDQVLAGGTAFMTDLGMCGDYDSVIGMEKSEPLSRFVNKIPSGRMSPASGTATLCGLIVETDPKTGLAMDARAIRTGGRLREAIPDVEPA
ncbi:MAG: TIGR00282 family metallophosphoesterase [Pseudomonadota bacterium]